MAAPAATPAVEPQATVGQAGVAATFHLTQLLGAARDGSPRSALVGHVDLVTELDYVSVPKLALVVTVEHPRHQSVVGLG